MSNATGKVVDDNSLFDEVNCLKIFVTFEKVTEWQKVSASVDKKWVQVFMFFRNQSMQLKNLEILIEFVLSIPSTNAQVERVFSLMKHYWTDDKSRLEVSTVKAILNTKFNSDDTCFVMYDKLLQNKNLLKKIHGWEKYKADGEADRSDR